jgi:hypothetical protein
MPERRSSTKARAPETCAKSK